MEWKKYLRIASVILLLYLVYSIGMPLAYVAAIGIFMILIIFAKDVFYKKIDGFITERFAFAAKLPSWTKKIIVILVFLLIYAAFKYVLFTSLKIVGIDIEQKILESINISKR